MTTYEEVYNTPFGVCTIIFHHNTIHALKFYGDSIVAIDDPEFIDQIFNKDSVNIPIYIEGTEFQRKVWEAARKIPFGTTATYSDIAVMINHPRAVRAVGTALGNNKIAYIIPCHRIVSKSSDALNYRWGGHVKKALLAWEKNVLDTESKLI